MVTGSIVTGVSQLPLVCKELSVEQSEVYLKRTFPENCMQARLFSYFLGLFLVQTYRLFYTIDSELLLSLTNQMFGMKSASVTKSTVDWCMNLKERLLQVTIDKRVRYFERSWRDSEHEAREHREKRRRSICTVSTMLSQIRTD